MREYPESGGGELGGSVSDSDLEKAVNRTLHQDPALQMHPFSVRARQGTVTLEGQLPSAELRQRAASLAASVRGVREVVNQIVVSDERA